MIAFTYGTTGELIKLAPVLRRLRERRAAVLGLCTGQQVEQIPSMLADFDLPEPDLWLARGVAGSDLERPREIPGWFARVSLNCSRNGRAIARRLRDSDAEPLMIVHGDTFTTVIGAALGRLLRVPVAHIEAGMRSGDLRNPFPEELNRRATAKLARIHFAPGRRAVENLRSEQVRGEIVDTGRNTISDNLRDVTTGAAPDIDIPDALFGLVSLHRFELLSNRDALSKILTVLRESAAGRAPLLFVDHPITAAAVDSAGLSRLFDSDRFVRIPRQRYFRFLSLLKVSSFLVTDSGGSQEECAFMGHPCLVHRAVTEHDTGLDGSVVLSRMNIETVRRFLDDPERYRCEPAPLAESPSEQIVRHLEKGGFLTGGYVGPSDEGDGAPLTPGRTTRG